MRIYSMTATFGKLEHATLTLQPGLNVIHAPNEWGKSTWCAFLTAMLYGIETRVHTTKTALADKERYVPWSGSPMSGRIDLNWNGRDITIERWSKGRTGFSQFRCYETDSGLPVPELTAANCGQMLLGVEKSVFLRSGFLRQADLPVTEDETLRRRLNALVTTGDESGTADLLSQKLRELKNRCKANRSTGLLPQLELQREQLEDKLAQLHQLQNQSEALQQQEQQLETYQRALENHRLTLAYQASRTIADKLATARNGLGAARLQCSQLEAACRQDPDPDVIARSLSELQQLRQSRDSLHFDAQLLDGPPVPPQVPAPFQGLCPEDACRQAKNDMQAYAACKKSGNRLPLLAAGVVLAAGGILSFIGKSWIFTALGALALVAGLLCTGGYLFSRQRAKTAEKSLTEKYAPMAPHLWEAAAAGWASAQEAYETQATESRCQQEQLRIQTAALEAKILAFTGGLSLQACEQHWTEARARQQALLEARRQVHQAEELVLALEASRNEVPPPDMPDTLVLTPPQTEEQLTDCAVKLRQLREKLGHNQGLTEALGAKDALLEQLAAVKKRIGLVEDMYAALEIAQNTLTKASAELQRRFAPQIAQRAAAVFSTLTGGRYDRLTLAEDLTVHAGAVGEDTLRSSLWRSDGTSDQLYLALRLAVAEALTSDAPMVLDDALVRFDEERLVRALQVLQETAQRRQVILFTCQKREAALLQTPNHTS